ncbi:alpha/beta hydrolase [Streptomyces sp. HNM0574]|nr:alpha/beta hydrolase [Streptomyces sp. HNM0574]
MERLAPEARPLMEAMTAFFPDLGGTVTDAAEARRVLAAAPKAPLPVTEVREVTDRLIPGPAGAPELPVRIYRPFGEGPHPTVVFLHGGGWVLCGIDTHDGTARGICREGGAVVVSVEYRLAPEARFPEPAEDAYAALCWAAEHVGELGGAPEALVMAGDSAGGNLAAAATLMARDRGGPLPAAQVLVYPATDLSGETDSHRRNSEGLFLTRTAMRWYAEQYVPPGTDLAHPYLSPLCADLTGMPPAHVVTAGCDPLCDEGRAYAAKLRACGVAVSEAHYPGMFHGFFGLAEALPDAAEAQRGVGKAVAETLPGRKNGGEDGVSGG